LGQESTVNKKLYETRNSKQYPHTANQGHLADKIEEYCKAKDKIKGDLIVITDELVSEFDEYIKSIRPQEYRRLKEYFGRIGDDELGVSPVDGIIGNMDLAQYIKRLFELKELMPKKGRLYYKLLPEDVKAEVDAFVAELQGTNEYIRNLVSDYADSKCRLTALYDSDPENLESHRQKAIDEADKLIANKILV
jgi:hypothetical protein